MRSFVFRLPPLLVCGTLVVVGVSTPSAAESESPPNAPADAKESATESSADAAEQPILLKYQFTINENIHYKVVHKMDIQWQKGKLVQSAKGDWTTHKHLRVISVDSRGDSLVESTIDRIQSLVQFDDEDPVIYDSASGKEAPPALKNVRRMIGKPRARIKLASNGRLISSVPLRNRGASDIAASKGSTDDPNGNPLVTLPEHPIRVGDSWKDTFIVVVTVPPKLERNITLGRTYTLTAFKDGKATIERKTSILTPINSPAIEAQLVQRQCIPTGRILFDTERGMIISRELTLNESVRAFSGNDSVMRAKSSLVETLVSPAEIASQKGTKVGPPQAKQ